MKPGYKTTEFWISTANAVIMVLVGLGVVSADQGETLGDSIASAIVAGFALVAAIVPVVEYIRGRTAVKAAQ